MSTVAEQKFYDDPKYRSYASQIEKALKNFEYSTEWADLISALVKLNKVLQANTSFALLPKRITIGKRLSQCLHPALPGGVHIKALDVYDTIFKIIGKKRLEMDLHIYGTGIFSLLANASMQVRPVLLNVYETHLLPLGENLLASLDGMLLGLLPGLEEGSEHFDRINLLLEKIAKSVGLQYFYSSLWRCVLLSTSGSVIRLAATQLVLRQFDKKKMTDDQLFLIGLDVDIMVHALCEALQDENVLTQRATLDVLGYCFPLSSLPVSRSDAQQILSSALNILLRRDMSLNRRLYSWLLGTDISKSSSSTNVKKSIDEYFEEHSRTILTCGILGMILTHVNAFDSSCCAASVLSVSGTEVKLLRIVISLLDKTEIGPVILNDFFIGILRLIQAVSQRYKSVLLLDFSCKKCPQTASAKEACTRAQSEFIKLVNLFVNTFETDYIWNVLAESFIEACDVGSDLDSSRKSQLIPDKTGFSIPEICRIIDTMLHIVSMETFMEVRGVHLPELLNRIFKELTKKREIFSEKDLAMCLQLSIEILKHIQPIQPNLQGNNVIEQRSGVVTCVRSFQDFIVAFITTKIIKDKDSIEQFSSDIHKNTASNLIVPTGYKVVMKHPHTLQSKERVKFQIYGELSDIMLQAFQDSCKLLVDICCFPTFHQILTDQSTEESVSETCCLPQWLLCLIACACCRDFGSSSIFPLNQENLDYCTSIRTTACSTVLELIAVTLTSFEKAIKSHKTYPEKRVTSIVVPTPLLSLSQIDWIYERTDFYERLFKILWSEIDLFSAAGSFSSRIWSTSRLLILLHQLCPDETIEQLILQDILSPEQNSRVEAIQKFAKLWKFMKEGSHGRKDGKNFSECLFAILDQLTIDRYTFFPDKFPLTSSDNRQSVVSTTVSVWLRQALEDGEMARILEPYMLLSLEARTHRKSLQNFLQGREERNGIDEIEIFEMKHEKDLSDSSCQNCADVQRDITDDASVWSEYQRFSVDSVLSFTLCEVHRQIAKEKHSYEHLVGLLTLSDEVHNLVKFKNTSNEEDLRTWVSGFVKIVITQALNSYKSRIENSEEHPFLNSENNEEIVSQDVLASDDSHSSDGSNVSQATEAIQLNDSFMMNENPLYNHVLIYQEKFDANFVLYGLQGILNIATAHPSVFIYSACTTSLSSSESSYSNLLQELLVRHERSIEQGTNFYDPTSQSLKGALKNRMLIEVLISICLYYLRSAFYDDATTREASLSHELHAISTKLLRFIVKELITLSQQNEASNKGLKMPSSTKQFSAYIILVLQRQQVQSVILTCLLTAIFALKNHRKSPEDVQSISNFSGTDVASNFDEEALHCSRSDHLVERYLGTDIIQIKTLFSLFLELVFELVALEHHAFSKEHRIPTQKLDETSRPSIALGKKFPSFVKPKLKRSQRLFSHLLSASHQYDSDSPLASQKVFVSTILEVYRLDSHLELHQECSIGLHSVLPYLGMALSATVVPILLQQCLNIENVSRCIVAGSTFYSPPSYLESTTKSMVALAHYCLLTETNPKNTEKGSFDSMQSDTVSLLSTKTSQSVGGSSIGSGLSTIFNVFNSSSISKSSIVSNEAERSDGLFAAKIAILNNLARMASCMCSLWKDIVSAESKNLLPSEELKGVSSNILEFLGPLAMRYGEYLVVAFSLVWQDREAETNGETKNVRSLTSFINSNPDLEHIIHLLMAIKLLPTETYFSLVKQVIRSPPPTTNEHKDVTLQESVLQMLLCYMRRLKPGILMESWCGFQQILQEILSFGSAPNNTTNSTGPIAPNCYFLLMYLLSEYVKRSVAFSGKKEQRELQEVVTKCIEACNAIARSSLEQGTWIRRNVSVLPGPQAPETAKTHRKTESQSSLDITDTQPESSTETQLHPSSSDTMVGAVGHKALVEVDEHNDLRIGPSCERPTSLPQISEPSINPVNFRNSVKALTVMSEVVANMLDVIYTSEEKEKVLPILVSIMGNVTPYSRNHGKDNAPSFCACITFLASISGFQYTRRAWRKDVIDLFLDTAFFHMPSECIGGWKTIIDNLMTHDKTTFKEVMSRTSLSKPGGSTPTLSIFSNKEQELELRALHIKRLAFIVFSSETDQYQKQLPEIQERLAESLRLSNVPGVQCRVFFCFSVLLVRISPHSLTSLWPTIFTELVHAMLQLEQALQPSFGGENHKIKPKSGSSKGSSPSSPGDKNTVMTCWLDMYLSACKLLDLVLCLPVHFVPQFQLYKWSFVGDTSLNANSEIPTEIFSGDNPQKVDNSTEVEEAESTFVPHCVRIQKIFSEQRPERRNQLLNIVPEKPLLNITRLKSLAQLQMFFNTITSPRYLLKTQNSRLSAKPSVGRSDSSDVQRSLPLVERNLEKDFVRPML